jgi:hypothetical protein
MMMPDLPELDVRCNELDLYVGDMIIDTHCNSVGVLTKRIHRISMTEDDLYFWMIYWTNQSNDDSLSSLERVSIQMEEEGLKISILLGMYELFPGESSYKR